MTRYFGTRLAGSFVVRQSECHDAKFVRDVPGGAKSWLIYWQQDILIVARQHSAVQA